MHVKDFWETFPLSPKMNLFWDRITFSRTTTIYFLFSVFHCAVQMIFQVRAFQANAQAANFLASIIEQGNAIKPDAFYVLGNDLRLCDNVPSSFSTNSCQVIWDGAVGNNTFVPTSIMAMKTTVNPSPATTTHSISNTFTIKSSHFRSAISSSTPIPTTTEGLKSSSWVERILHENVVVKRILPSAEIVQINGAAHVVVNDLGWHNESATFDRKCLWVLGWPVQILRNTKREDFTFIMFQIWLLGMSIVAILNESVPHTVASLLTHLVATGWAGFQIFNTAQFRNDFAEMTINGACHSTNLLPTYWQSRSVAEIASLILNAVALLISAFLSWRLTKSFGWQTYKRIGASLTISQVYKIVLTLSIVIQLSFFFIVTSIALWLDQLWNGAIGHLVASPVGRPLLILTLILLPLWLISGWYSARRERKLEMLIFLSMCLGYLAGWGALFDSATFRWTYMTWTFFGVMTTTSVFLTVLSFILGVMCRFNFGKGLLHYLNAQQPVEDSLQPVITDDLEKAVFPSSKEQAFFAAFGSGVQVPPPPPTVTRSAWYRFAQPMRMTGQRFPQLYIRDPSERVYHHHSRQPSQNSVHSRMCGSSEGVDNKRWVIE